jgi:hypothetical protein
MISGGLQSESRTDYDNRTPPCYVQLINDQWCGQKQSCLVFRVNPITGHVHDIEEQPTGLIERNLMDD